MSQEESESVRSEKPVMDDETYAFVQELFHLARAGDAEHLKELLGWKMVGIFTDW